MTEDRSGANGPTPIFVFGVLGRSGTNFLSDLLCLHPDCVPAHPLDEDFFHFHADLLERWAGRTAVRWHLDWGVSQSGPDRLLASLGRGLLAHLRETAEAYGGPGAGAPRIITKTPSVKNLGLFPRLFPGVPAVVLLRDGRAVVESLIRSFGGQYEARIRSWAWAARVILETALADPAPDSPFCVVHYRDLLERPETELRRIFSFTGLDPDKFDFEQSQRLPVRGSSTFRRSDDGVDWRPVERTDEFQPLRRWADWPAALHARFNWLAGPEMEALGYELVGPRGGPLYALRNRSRDLVWRLGSARRQRNATRRRARLETSRLDG